jgi:hypothetical protein
MSYPGSHSCPFIYLLSLAPVVLKDGCIRVLEDEKAVKGGINVCLPAEDRAL